MGTTITGLDRLLTDYGLQKEMQGNIAYLCHNASIDRNCREGLGLMIQLFGKQLKVVFSPQHGLFAEAQDNMIESDHFVHPFYKIPVYSLYSETRTPTPEMLDGIQHLVVDLQDIGSRTYTFIYTMTLTMQVCGDRGIKVWVLDRPNPLNGIDLEGNVLDSAFKSFIGLHPLPMRHGLTIGEIAKMAVSRWGIDCDLTVVTMENWDRSKHFGATKLPWVYPSPNMPHIKTAKVFPGTVFLEGTNLSEGRGTTRPFEIFGHPASRPHEWLPQLNDSIKKSGLGGFTLRPLYFQPTFEKHKDITCGGYQIHITDWKTFKPWRSGLLILNELYHAMGSDFGWRQPPFEYEELLLPIDMLNGTDKIRRWIESGEKLESLEAIEKESLEEFRELRKDVLMY